MTLQQLFQMSEVAFGLWTFIPVLHPPMGRCHVLTFSAQLGHYSQLHIQDSSSLTQKGVLSIFVALST
jgi:hypothetical protein